MGTQDFAGSQIDLIYKIVMSCFATVCSHELEFLTLQVSTPQNGQTQSNNSSAKCWRIAWVR